MSQSEDRVLKGLYVKSFRVGESDVDSYWKNVKQTGSLKEKSESKARRGILEEKKKRNSYLENYQWRQSVLK